LLNAALDGSLFEVDYYTDPIFGFKVPKSAPQVPNDVLYPAFAWVSEDAYMKRYRGLASRFIDNFKKFEDKVTREVRESGPRILKGL
jgi:phosphoenolpyruvate carboxykinase (ATP)